MVMENYDPEFSARTNAGDVLVGASNFGTGSSREQAVTALQAKGIAIVIAATFSQTYLRNAYNNGFACVECPELVARGSRSSEDGDRGRRPDVHSRRFHEDRFCEEHGHVSRRDVPVPAAGVRASVARRRRRGGEPGTRTARSL